MSGKGFERSQLASDLVVCCSIEMVHTYSVADPGVVHWVRSNPPSYS